MSDFQHYLKEKERIDTLINSDYVIEGAIENLSGAHVQFSKYIDGEKKIKTLHILTADARKYFSVMMVLKNKGKQNPIV